MRGLQARGNFAKLMGPDVDDVLCQDPSVLLDLIPCIPAPVSTLE